MKDVEAVHVPASANRVPVTESAYLGHLVCPRPSLCTCHPRQQITAQSCAFAVGSAWLFGRSTDESVPNVPLSVLGTLLAAGQVEAVQHHARMQTH